MTSRPRNTDEFVILHATDLLADSQPVFEQAIALALAGSGRLVSLHAADGSAQTELPEFLEVFEKWGTSVEQFEHDTLVYERQNHPRNMLIKIIEELRPDLLIVGTRMQQGEPRKFRGSVSEVVALETHVPTLVVHIGEPGLIDAKGKITLNRVLVPVGDGDEAREAIGGLTRLLDQLAIDDVDIYLLRVGDAEILEHITTPERAGRRYHKINAQGLLADVISKTCEDKNIDLIAMATRGQDGVVDLISGTHTQRVIRRTPRPVLVVKVP
ncbi:MAG: universal stress protein [Bradymonadaceae bacterium]|nr:universal stress protein [Lujinxingiaceae bacterium]